MKIINYPAMASPPSIEHINNIVNAYCEKTSTILDPYCGTGRLLIQPRLNGHNVIGIDCSPIALLSARVLHQNSNTAKLDCILDQIIFKAKKRRHRCTPENDELFWFEENSYSQLVNLLTSIDEIDISRNIQRIFWLILTDTIRKVSYLREDEYKLHRIKPDLRESWKPDAYCIFYTSAKSIFKRLETSLNGKPKGQYRFHLGDIAQHPSKSPSINAIITSPPYGDSRTTVGYGQFARVPLIILAMSSKFRSEYKIDYSKNLDTVCLGGTNCFTMTPTKLPKEITNINGIEMERFFIDYFARLNILDSKLDEGGIACFILANRVYKGQKVPLIEATSSYFSSIGYKSLLKVDRLLSLKRLPRSMRHLQKSLTKSHTGMNYETVLAFQKQ